MMPYGTHYEYVVYYPDKRFPSRVKSAQAYATLHTSLARPLERVSHPAAEHDLGYGKVKAVRREAFTEKTQMAYSRAAAR